MIDAALAGLAAGVLAGLLGVGGGILFVPALTIILGLSQLRAEATSLLAIIPVAIVGVVRQRSYGNVNLREGLTVGALGILGSTAGVTLANAIPQRALEVGFGVILLVIASQIARGVLFPTVDPVPKRPSRPRRGS